MTNYRLLLLPGDGIGVETMAEVERVIAFLNKSAKAAKFETESDLVGGAAYDKHGVAITDAAMDKAHKADAVIFGAVGGPKWDGVAYAVRPEAGLLRLRKDLGLFANLRPAICYPALADASALKRELVEGLDIMIVRELTGGVYFGEPKEIVTLEDGQKRAVDTQVYTTHEIERIARVAFDLARKRSNKVHSAEKRNVMRTGVLWNEVVTATHKAYAPDVELQHILADNCAMQLVRNPKQFDVIVTDNLFGDVLSDEAAMTTGSLGMLPSASLGAPDPKTGRSKALYEPVHGSAPDIAGKGLANPIASIASFGMALRYSFGLSNEADLLDQAIAGALADGLRTGDIMQPGMKKVGTAEMGAAIVERLGRLAA
jgi:3-isopropylmalate dehydrogenase